MENLLRWGIEHSSDGGGIQREPPRSVQELDPGVIDMILGKPDAELMKEALATALDENKDEDERVQALDDFEMLIEQIDNANNIDKLKMWEPLQGLLQSPSSSDEIKIQVLWIIGTAVQNNPSAQAAYLALSPMPTLVSFLGPSVKSGKLRSKAIYALSGLLKHNTAAVQQFEAAGGWEVLRAALEDSDITVRRKTAFLLNTLIIPIHPMDQPTQSSSNSGNAGTGSTGVTLHSPVQQPAENAPVHPNSHASMQKDPSSFATAPAALKALEQRGLLQALVSAITRPTPHGPDGETEGDADLDEKVIRSLHTYVTASNGELSDNQKQELGAYLKQESGKVGGEPKLAEKLGLTGDELDALKKAIK